MTFHSRDWARQARGIAAYHSGAKAEDKVRALYLERGYEVEASRWRGKSGEIDLIFEKGGEFIFVEVKCSQTFDQAAARLSRQQMNRICNAACEFVATKPSGQDSAMRFDAALVDAAGAIDVIEGAFMEA